MEFLKRLFGSMAALLFVMVAWPAVAAEYRGTLLHAIDGDTFDLKLDGGGRVRIRLCGIDAPERGATGYAKAQARLHKLLDGQPITCRVVGNRTPCDGRSRARNRDRVVAACYTNAGVRADGGKAPFDVAARIVLSGDACDWPKFSGGHYQRRWAGIEGFKACVRND